MLRVVRLADGTGDYRVMPGGLSRIAGDERHVVSGQRGGEQQGHLGAVGRARSSASPCCRGTARSARTSRAASATISSRAAEHLFWLGATRSAARTAPGCSARCSSRLPVRRRPAARGCAQTFIAHAAQRLLRPDAATRPRRTTVGKPTPPRARADRRHVRPSQDAAQPGVQHRAARVRVAGAVRDRLSSDNWRLLNRLYEAFDPSRGAARRLAEALELLDDAIVSLVAVGGLEMAHMTRDDGWRFLSLGRHLERLALRRRRSSPRRPRPVDAERAGAPRVAARPRPTASSRTGPATCASRSGCRSSICCCSTSATRARRLSSSPSSPSTCGCSRRPVSRTSSATVDARRGAACRTPDATARDLSADPRGGRGLPARLRAARAAPLRRADAALLQPRLRAAARDGDDLMSRPSTEVEHETGYVYGSTVSTSQHVAYLRPRDLPRQTVHWSRSTVDPPPSAIEPARRLLRQRRRPVHGADAAPRAADARAQPGRGASVASARSSPRRARPGSSSATRSSTKAGKEAARRSTRSRLSSRSPRRTSRSTPSVAAFARASFSAGPAAARRRPIDLMHRIHDEFRSTPRRRRSRRRSRACWRSGAASARTSRTSRSPACARSASRRAT